MVVYLSARCLLSFAMENTSRARHRHPLNCADLYGLQTSRPLRLQQRVLSRRLKDDDLAPIDTTEDRKPLPRCHALLTFPPLLSSLFPPFWPRQRHSLLPPFWPRQRHSRLAWGKQQFWTECLAFWGGESLFLYPFFCWFAVCLPLSCCVACITVITGSTLKRSV